MPTLNPEVVAALQADVAAHWMAIEFYRSVAAHFKRWGYRKLAKRFKGEVKDEGNHMARLLRRLEYADVPPGFKHDPPSVPRHDVVAILTAAVAIETEAAAIENAGAVTARDKSDEVSARLFGHLVVPSEHAIEEMTADLRTIEEIGVQNYLQDQL